MSAWPGHAYPTTLGQVRRTSIALHCSLADFCHRDHREPSSTMCPFYLSDSTNLSRYTTPPGSYLPSPTHQVLTLSFCTSLFPFRSQPQMFISVYPLNSERKGEPQFVSPIFLAPLRWTSPYVKYRSLTALLRPFDSHLCVDG